MPVSFAVRPLDFGSLQTPLLVLALEPSATAGGALAPLDAALGGALTRTLERRDFRGGRDETLHLSGTDRIARILLVGLGSGAERSLALRRAATLAGRQAHRMGVGAISWFSGDLDAAGAEAVAVGIGAGSWEYRELKTPPKEEERRAPLAEAVILTGGDADGIRAGVAAGEALDAGYALARRLGMMPGNLCTPEYLARTAQEIGKRHGMKVTVLGRQEMEELKMGSFLSVAWGTPEDPKLITLEYRGGAADAKPVALVGKGLCFDTGGISIKPAAGMEWMKFDMCGAAGVLGAMETIGRLKLPVNVVGLVGSTTNMPSGTAVKPGDVVHASSGKSIEVINTDAEGRLVLADVLAYAKRFEPTAVVDAATLTGACVIALGHVATGVFGSDEALIQEVIAAGKRASEPGWPLPLWDEYREQIKSDVADLKNTGGRPAGSITAALFLKEFADGYPWVHLDIAGTAYSESDLVVMPKGPTGVPVGTFVNFVRGRAG